MAKKQRFRIFIGSPGDVAPERTVTDKVIQQLQAEYGGWVDLEWDRYENKALPANEPPQRNISDPATFDVAVFLFWHSIGSQPLPDEFRLADGSTAASGTLWEFDRAYFGVEQDGVVRRPFVLAYKKDDPLLVGSVEELERAQRGFRDIDAFAKRYIHDGTFHGYWTRYGGNELKVLLERHLREWLSRRIPDVVAAIPEIPAWTLGKSPFPGLASFTDEYASQFYGREQEIVDVCNRVEEAERSEKLPFLIVTGSSGVGKSSLLKAGVVPEMRRRALAKGSMFRRVVFRPSESSAGALHSLAEALLSDDGMKELRLFCPDGSAELADQLRRNPDLAADRIGQAICGIRPIPDGARLVDDPGKECIGKVNTLREAGQQFVLVVDQFEELFAEMWPLRRGAPDSAVSLEESRDLAAFSAVLVMLVDRFGFVVLGSMRDDFLPNLNATVELKSVAMRGLVGIGPVSSSDLHRIIEFPVRAAGYEFEKANETNQSLATVIFRDVDRLAPLLRLPVLQFVLLHLFERAKNESEHFGILRILDYQELGGVQGLLARRAEEEYSCLNAEEKQAARRIFLSLFSIESEDDRRIVGRTTEYRESAVDPEAARVVKRFVDSNILVRTKSRLTGGDILSVPYEGLIEEWRTCRNWVLEKKEFVRLLPELEAQAVRWVDSGSKSRLLVLRGRQLERAQEFVAEEVEALSGPMIVNYVNQCGRNAARRNLWMISLLFVYSAWGISYSVRDLQFQPSSEAKEILLGASVFLPYLFVRLIEKWLAMTRAAQRQWRSLYWGFFFLAVYWLWGRHQSGDSEGLHHLWMVFGLAWTWLFPAAYHLTVAGFGPLTRTAHRLRRRTWWRLYVPVHIVVLLAVRIVSVAGNSPFRAAAELTAGVFAIWLAFRFREWLRWLLSCNWLKRREESIRNEFDKLLAEVRRVWGLMRSTFDVVVPPSAIGFGLFLVAPALDSVVWKEQKNVGVRASPVPATFFVPNVVVLDQSNSRDAGAWWQAAMLADQKTLVGLTAASPEGQCDANGHPEALWGYLRREGLTEGGLSIKGGCKVGRTFNGERLIEELVYNDIEKPLMRRVPREGGFDVLLANDDGSMSRRGYLVQLAEEGGERRWLYTAIAGRKPAQAGVTENPGLPGDRRLWTYSQATDRFRVMRVDEVMRPTRFDGEEYSTLEIGRDKAGQLATLRYLDSNGDAVADASGTHRIEFSYGSRGQCKMAIAFTVDGSELSRKPCRDTRFELVED